MSYYGILTPPVPCPKHTIKRGGKKKSPKRKGAFNPKLMPTTFAECIVLFYVNGGRGRL